MTPALWAVAVAALAVAATLPYWLPTAVVALRVRIFDLVNGEEGIAVPGRLVGTESFTRLYGHPAANGRSKGAALSDLFWYWLAPGPEVHQEHLEPGPRYDQVARVTRRLLTGARKDEWSELVARCTGHVLDERPATATGAVRLRDLMMPVWAEVYYELVFGEPCPRAARDLIVGNADDVVSALKCTGLRHMDRRDRLTEYLLDRIRRGDAPAGLPDTLTEREQAYYLQGTFFNTAVVQMSEAMAHLLLVIAEHPGVRHRLTQDPPGTGYLDRVVEETLRVWPLFGIAHRVTSADIVLDGAAAIPAGSVLLFNYADYQHDVPDGDRFDPDRWLRATARDIPHIPFGVSANRPCPARGIAPLTMRVAAEEVLRRFEPMSSAGHARSLPNRAPCLLVPRPAAGARGGRPVLRLALMRVRDRWEDVWRSLVQLALGSYMVWDARRQALCRRYFETAEAAR
ncbi:cytochrome P450 [Streptantibioticus silvisoli]|jgi:cytochrome P450|uniref:Cytochrome P450 n=1 Tax=Streptantibioticus silvisoli TaxID=2705255 RepID=A0ABT6W4I6_9ACTN|nr:cytochrome P450 [Streptantibioticus silvisoli]MDI5965589.1 cytochrome P450 [Streptantibioticus silvisoli]